MLCGGLNSNIMQFKNFYKCHYVPQSSNNKKNKKEHHKKLRCVTLEITDKVFVKKKLEVTNIISKNTLVVSKA
jgi:hypothetical protein